jgi:hypothetical protein
MAILNVQHEQLTHSAHFSRPLFDLWGNGKTILNGVYGAFRPLGATVASIRVEGSAPADQHVSVVLGNVTHAFRFDRIETTFVNPTEQVFASIPTVLQDALSWVRAACPDVPVAAHQFVHFTHSKLEDESLEEVLSRVGPAAPRSGGQATGSGAVFHWTVPENGWLTQLTVDKSLAIKDGIFVMVSISVATDKIEFGPFAEAGRGYLLRVLEELGLTIPAFE